MAVERFGGNGLALGAYRSLQIGLGALAGIAIGNSPLGLRWTILLCAPLPLSLLWFCRPETSPAPPAPHPRPRPLTISTSIWSARARFQGP